MSAQILIDKRITVQPIYVRSTDGTTFTSNAGQILYEAETDKIWSQAGIDVQFLAPMYYNDSSFLNPLNAFGSTNSVQALGQVTGQAWSTGNGLANTVVRLFFVQQLESSNNVLGFAVTSGLSDGGFGIGINQQTSMAIADSTFTIYGHRDVIAHELGHLLGLDHDADLSKATFGGNGSATNLMSSGTARTPATFIGDIYPDGSGLDRLTGTIGGTNYGNDIGPVNGLQIDRARRMNIAVTLAPGDQYIYGAIPEPSATAAIAGSLVLLLVGICRHRRMAKSVV